MSCYLLLATNLWGKGSVFISDLQSFRVAVAETPQLLFIVHCLLFIFLVIPFPVFPKGEKPRV